MGHQPCMKWINSPLQWMIDGSFDWLVYMAEDGLSELTNEWIREWRIGWICSQLGSADFNSWRWRFRLEISYSDWNGFWRHEPYDRWSDGRMNGWIDPQITGRKKKTLHRQQWNVFIKSPWQRSFNFGKEFVYDLSRSLNLPRHLPGLELQIFGSENVAAQKRNVNMARCSSCSTINKRGIY